MRYTSRLSSDRSNGGDNGDDGSGGGSGVNEANFGDGGGTSGDGGDGVGDDGYVDGVGISTGLLRRPEREALLVIRGTTETADWSINMEEAPLLFEYLHSNASEEGYESVQGYVHQVGDPPGLFLSILTPYVCRMFLSMLWGLHLPSTNPFHACRMMTGYAKGGDGYHLLPLLWEEPPLVLHYAYHLFPAPVWYLMLHEYSPSTITNVVDRVCTRGRLGCWITTGCESR